MSTSTMSAHPLELRGATQNTCRFAANRALNYVTNHVVGHIPSFWIRQAWYRTVLGIEIGNNSFIFMGCYLWFHGLRNLRRGGLVIGRDCRINRRCLLDTRGSLRIGNNVSISPDVAILTASHNYEAADFQLIHRGVVIEDHVWIGTRAIVMPGVTIRRNAVVAAGAVVTSDVDEGDVVGGVPARFIKRRRLTDQNTINSPAPFFE